MIISISSWLHGFSGLKRSPPVNRPSIDLIESLLRQSRTTEMPLIFQHLTYPCFGNHLLGFVSVLEIFLVHVGFRSNKYSLRFSIEGRCFWLPSTNCMIRDSANFKMNFSEKSTMIKNTGNFFICAFQKMSIADKFLNIAFVILL